METLIVTILLFAMWFIIEAAFLLLALWVMIKIQKLDYNFLGLLGTAMLGAGLDMIPFVGHYIAVVALYICIWKVTRSDLFPDAVFTVVVAFALTFCMNLFLLGALMDDLMPSAGGGDELETTFMGMDGEMGTNQLMAMDFEADAEQGSMATPAAFTKKVETTNTARVSPATSATKATPATKAAPAAKPQNKSAKANETLASVLVLKGVTVSGSKSIAAIHSGTKTYTIGLGETISMQTPKGGIRVRCEEVEAGSVILSVDGERLELFLQ